MPPAFVFLVMLLGSLLFAALPSLATAACLGAVARQNPGLGLSLLQPASLAPRPAPRPALLPVQAGRGTPPPTFAR